MRTTKSVTISLPPEQLKTAERLAKKENRTMSELFREALRRYQQEESGPNPAALAQFRSLFQALQQDARSAGKDKIIMAEIDAEIAAARKERRKKKSINRAGA